jgi:hypothetical protein
VSWDVWLFVPPSGTARIEDVRPDYQFPPLDPVGVMDVAREVFGSAWLLHDGWGNIDGPEIFAEVSLPHPDDDSSYRRGSVQLHVRGFGERTVEKILEFADELGCRAFDNHTGDWLSLVEGQKSVTRWQGYRAQVTEDDVVGGPGEDR